MAPSSFVHLHCQSEYSVKNSLIRVPKLIERVKELGMNSVALTDDFSLFSAIKFYQKSIALGVKPIFGASISISSESDLYEVILLCQNHQGYLNLSEIISNGYLGKQSFKGPMINEEELILNNEGLIMISKAIDSDISQLLLDDELTLAEKKALKWKSIFGNRFYMATQRTDRPDDEQQLQLTVDLGLALDIPVVATNDVQFLYKNDYQAHEARICIAEGVLLDDARRLKRFTESQFLKSADEMVKLFADFPSSLINTVEISKRCNLHFELFEKNYLPVFPTPQGLSIAQYFKEESEKGLR